tara:strand:+ start:467 stop:658 length:192 start_codon:yes stop_codon:yes gene_type:complete
MGICYEIIKNERCYGKIGFFEPIVKYWADEEKGREGIFLLHEMWCNKCGIVKEYRTRYLEVEE